MSLIPASPLSKLSFSTLQEDFENIKRLAEEELKILKRYEQEIKNKTQKEIEEIMIES